MSVRAMSVVWGWAMPAAEKLVALKLADCAGDDGRNAFPAVATIAAECGLSRRGAQLVLRRLAHRGYIEVQAVATNRSSTRYRVLLGADVPRVQMDAGGEPDSPLEANDVHLQGRTTCTPGANHVRPGGEPRSPLGANDVRPIRQGSISDPSRARRAPGVHPLDEAIVPVPRLLELLDELKLAYPRKDGDARTLARVWRELNLTIEQAEFVVAHVRMRVAAGWVSEVGGVRYIKHLWRWLEARCWQEQSAAPAGAGWGPDRTPVWTGCQRCGEALEGRVKGGKPVYPPCTRCVGVRQEGDV